MGNGFQFFDIILFAMVAAFLVLRLRSVLGKKTGHQRQRQNPMAGRRRGGGQVVELPARADDAAGAPGPGDGTADGAGDGTADGRALPPGVSRIAAADPSFDPEGFLGGAQAAFEMIVGAFAAGDVRALQNLLSDEVLENFRNAIERRAEAGETLETTIISIRSAAITDADVEEGDAVVTVSFESEQVNVTRDSENRVVDGDPSQVTEVVDIWTFRRALGSSDPNWRLVETRSRG